MERRGSRLSRRGFVVGAAGLGLLAGCGRLPGQAPPPAQVRRIGVLAFESRAASERATAAVRQELRHLGYDEHHLAVEYRAADWQPQQLPERAAELVAQGVEASW